MSVTTLPEPGDTNPLLLSIITVVLNDRLGLLRTFRSLQKQDQGCEWVVIDGASNDGSAQLIAQIATDNTRWSSQSDEGIYDAMNRGVELATGSHLLFLNAGDTLHGPGVVSALTARLRADLDLLFCDALMVVHDEYRIPRLARSPVRSLWRGLPALHQATVFSRRALTLRPYDASFAIAGDYDAMAALISANLSYEIADVVVAEFAVGGTSFRRPFRLMVESNRVRRDVLGLPRWQRLVASSANLVSNIALWVIWRTTGWWLALRRVPSHQT